MEQIIRSSKIEEMLNKMSLVMFNMTRDEAWAKGICIDCKGGAINKCYSDAGKREYQISALCEDCWDEWTKGGR